MNSKQAKAQRRRARQKENRKLGKVSESGKVSILKKGQRARSRKKPNIPVSNSTAYEVCTDWNSLAVGASIRFQLIEMCPLGNGVQLKEYSGNICRISQSEAKVELENFDCEFSLPDMLELEYRRVQT